jgi:hypothetical protein
LLTWVGVAHLSRCCSPESVLLTWVGVAHLFVFCVCFFIFFIFVFVFILCLVYPVFVFILCLVYPVFVFILCLVYPMLPVSIDCLFLIALSVFSNVYFYWLSTKVSIRKVIGHQMVDSWQLIVKKNFHNLN